MSMGIYSITNIKSNKNYIGSALNIEKRWKRHKTDLRCQKHHSHHLQKAWNKYGPECFLFEIIEIIDNSTNLLQQEQFYLNQFKSYDSNFGYNINPIAGSCLGTKRSKEYKEKMSIKNQGECSHFAKLDSESIKKIIEQLLAGKKVIEIAQTFKVTKQTIYNIRKKKTWNNINRNFFICGAATGSRQQASKLNENDIPLIREKISLGYTDIAIANEFNIKRRTINDIRRRITWKHV